MAVHLDHGDTFELCKECIDEGFTSVMIDGSHEPFAKNVELCRRVVEYAHPRNCVVEGELGMLVGAQHDEGEEGGGYSRAAPTPTPSKPWISCARPGWIPWPSPSATPTALTNSKAPNTWTWTASPPSRSLMDAGMGDYPLVLHGASSVPKDLVQEINKYGGKLGEDTAGVPEADIEIARRTGCAKVNIDTDLRLAMTAAIRKCLFETPRNLTRGNTSAPPAPASRNWSATKCATSSVAPARLRLSEPPPSLTQYLIPAQRVAAGKSGDDYKSLGEIT